MTKITVSRLGRQGDGIGVLDGSEVFVPLSLPSETVLVSKSGMRRNIEKILEPSKARIDPICRHFGICGGCQLQHMEKADYLEWKKHLVVDPLLKAGIDCAVDAVISFPVASRRKAVFSANRINGELHLGFSQRNSNTIIDIEECPVLSDELTEALPDIQTIVASLSLGAKPIRVSVLATTTGIDMEIEGSLKLSPLQRTSLTQKAIESGLARLSLNQEVQIEAKRPILEMGIGQVTPPPGGFVQAIEDAENKMAKLVCEHLARSKNVADLFCGSGTFALRLAEQSSVWAVEENQSAIEALERAWRETGGKLKQIKVETRNLERRPVSFQELKKIDGLVFDPPRAGAETQARQIAKSKVQRVAAVSCNPVTLARDMAILIEGGYRTSRIVPIDQFRFTPHVEVVALLER